MVKLIKLVGGDGNANSNGVINNVFGDSIRIQPNSRIALRSCQVVLAQDADKEANFPVETGLNTYGYRINGGSSDALANVVIPVNEYQNASQVLHAMQIAANSTAAPNSKFDGVHHQYGVISDFKTALEVYKASPARADFANWFYQRGDPSKSLNKLDLSQSLEITNLGSSYTAASGLAVFGGSGAGLTVTITVDGASEVTSVSIDNAGDGNYAVGDVLTIQQGGSGNDCTINLFATETFQLRTIPSVLSTQKFTLSQVGSFQWSVTPLDDGTIQFYGLVVQGNATAGYNYATVANGVVSARAEVPANGDVIELTKSGPSSTVKVTRLGGSLVFSVTQSITDLEEQNLSNFVSATAGSSAILDDATTTTLDLQGGGDSGVSHTVHLVTNSIPVFRALGFTNGSTFNASGAPAVILSPNPATGTLERSGVIVALEGLDLDTYIGSVNAPKGGGVNVLDVLFADPNDLRTLTQQVSFPMPLDVKNQREIVIRDLRVRFLNNDLRPISITGQASVVLELYGPNESS